jgi:hypothetical protein
MNLEVLRQKLVRSARRHPVSDAVPYAFEQRVMHAIRNTPAPDPYLPWVAGLWRAALCALAVALLSSGFHWRELVNDPTATVQEVPDAELLEVAVLGDLPGFEPTDPAASTP